MVTHDPLVAQFANRIILIDEGKIIQDSSPDFILEEFKSIFNQNKGELQ